MNNPCMKIDLNADLGESFGHWILGDDEAMLDVVSSANVACGFHAGDPATLVRSCAAAVARRVTIGAQVGYRDLPGFGRRFIDVAPDDLYADVLYQLGALDGIARSVGGEVAYVKPHGALYNAIVHHTAQAQAVVNAVAAYGNRARPLPILGLPGSEVLRLAQVAGLRTVAEAFADRAYTAEATLVSRREVGSVLHDPDEVAQRVVGLITTGELTAIDGSTVQVVADSVCIHGDSPDAVGMAVAVRTALTDAGIEIAPFAAASAG